MKFIFYTSIFMIVSCMPSTKKNKPIGYSDMNCKAIDSLAINNAKKYFIIKEIVDKNLEFFKSLSDDESFIVISKSNYLSLSSNKDINGFNTIKSFWVDGLIDSTGNIQINLDKNKIDLMKIVFKSCGNYKHELVFDLNDFYSPGITDESFPVLFKEINNKWEYYVIEYIKRE